MKFTKEQLDAIRKSKLLRVAQAPQPVRTARPNTGCVSTHGEEVHNPHFHAHNLAFEQMLRKAGV